MVDVGTQVQIKRSDGRVHPAVVSSYNETSDSVSVEWFENDETKGKEIELATVLALNPQLKDKPKKVPVVKDTAKKKKKTTGAAAAALAGGVKSPPPAMGSAKSPMIPMQLSVEGDNPMTLAEAAALRRNEKEKKRVAAAEVAEEARRHERQQQQLQLQSDHAEDDDHYENGTPAASDAAGHGLPKKHRAVVEVERIQREREERRQKQEDRRQAMLDQMAPSNPNWEFLRMIQRWQSKQKVERMGDDEAAGVHRICVAVRKRPLNRREVDSSQVDVLTIIKKDTVTVHEPKLKVDLTKYLENHNFRFDYAFDEDTSNEAVYRYTAKPLVETIFDQGMATCFAYGQTGSGKTFTMGGNVGGAKADFSRGIYALASRDVFRLAALDTNVRKDLVVCVSFFEIYGGKVFDLLNSKKKLRVLEDGKNQVNVVGLEERDVATVEDVFRCIQIGNNVRTSGQTSANDESSRSHAVFQIILRKRRSKALYGKFSLIDLAGNERGADTRDSDRRTRLEGAEINKSLLALKECIRALGRNKHHTPFRASKLTLVLRDSFIGEKARTCMIATMSPGSASCEHTLNTLRYADRVKGLPGKGAGASSSSGPSAIVAAKPPPAPGQRARPAHPQVSASVPQPQESSDDDEAEEGADDLAELHRSLRHQGSVLEGNDQVQKFHEAVQKIAETEEMIIEEHRQMVSQTRDMLKREEELLGEADNADADIEAYSRQLDTILAAKQRQIESLRARLAQYHAAVQIEEATSRNIKRLPIF